LSWKGCAGWGTKASPAEGRPRLGGADRRLGLAVRVRRDTRRACDTGSCCGGDGWCCIRSRKVPRRIGLRARWRRQLALRHSSRKRPLEAFVHAVLPGTWPGSIKARGDGPLLAAPCSCWGDEPLPLSQRRGGGRGVHARATAAREPPRLRGCPVGGWPRCPDVMAISSTMVRNSRSCRVGWCRRRSRGTTTSLTRRL